MYRIRCLVIYANGETIEHIVADNIHTPFISNVWHGFVNDLKIKDLTIIQWLIDTEDRFKYIDAIGAVADFWVEQV